MHQLFSVYAEKIFFERIWGASKKLVFGGFSRLDKVQLIPVIEPDDIKGVAGANLIPETARDTRSSFSGNGP